MTTTNELRQKTFMERFTRDFLLRWALPLDMLAVLIRILEAGCQVIAPDAYHAFMLHTNPVLALLFLVAGSIVLSAMAVGITTAYYIIQPLKATVNSMIEAAGHIRNGKQKKYRLDQLHKREKRYNGYMARVIVVGSVFFTAFLLPSTGIGEILSAIATIVTPFVVLNVIGEAEHELDNVDSQATAMKVSNEVVISLAQKVGDTFDGEKLDPRQALILTRAGEADLPGVIDAAVQRDKTERYYTITDLCMKYGADPDKSSSDRAYIRRKVVEAANDADNGVYKDNKKGWMVPGKILDTLFGDWKPQGPVFRLQSDNRWTNSGFQVAPQAE